MREMDKIAAQMKRKSALFAERRKPDFTNPTSD